MAALAGSAFLSFFVVVWRVYRRPPAQRAFVESSGARVLRFAPWRRVMVLLIALSVLIGPFSHSELDLGSLWVAAFVFLFLALAFVTMGERYRFDDAWIERAGSLRPRRRWEWAKIQSVVEIPGGVFLRDSGGRELVISSKFFDGYAEFMARVLSRVRPGRPDALRTDDTRDDTRDRG
jgi:hypothetical protein